ncbi:MAG: tetratricopeptide repeat protein [Pseudomonadota bacterium]
MRAEGEAQEHRPGRERSQREQELRARLERDPGDAEALNELGVACFEAGRRREAADLFERAMALDPRDAVFRCNLGNALAVTGRPEAAIAHYRKAILADPRLAQAHFLLGNALRDLGRDEEAAAAYGLAIGLDPRLAAAERQLAAVCRRLGRKEAAIAAYRRALAIEPDRPTIRFNLGNLLREQGSLEEAAACYREALRLQPGLAAAACNLGQVLEAQGRLDEAEMHYRRALAADGRLVEAARNLAGLLERRGKNKAAIGAYEALTALAADDAGAWTALGRLRQRDRQPIPALAAFRRALDLAPTDVRTLVALMPTLVALDRPDEAIAAGKRALALAPGHGPAAVGLLGVLQSACRWQEAASLAALVDRLTDAALIEGAVPDQTPGDFLAHSTDGAKLRRIAAAWSRAAAARVAHAMLRRRALDRDPERRLRVAYLSADAHDRAAGPLLRALFRQHDRRRVEVFGFLRGFESDSDERAGIAADADRFVDLSDLRPEIAAQRIADEAVDILVDLDGHGATGAMEILALRPAALQVAWPGFPGTTGADYVDYVLADAVTAPAADAALWREAICRLPHGHRPLAGEPTVAEQPASRAGAGLPEDAPVLACFNDSDKIEPAMFRLWMELLGALPGAVLWLLSGGGPMEAELKRQAAARGVAPERLHFAPVAASPEHRRRLMLADLVLDTHPCNGPAATGDALSVGVPVVTLRGNHCASRMSASLLEGVGVPELIAADLEGYRRIVLRYARDEVALAGLKDRLRAARKTAPLFDLARFARTLERAYRAMWRAHLAGRAPEALDIAEEGASAGGPGAIAG